MFSTVGGRFSISSIEVHRQTCIARISSENSMSNTATLEDRDEKGKTLRNDKGQIGNFVEKDLHSQEEEEKEEKWHFIFFMVSLEKV